ncbi:MAG: hypothetical protein ACI906_001263 [Candidatus Latescibacterota bacterium]|jgi:hypothetical protein
MARSIREKLATKLLVWSSDLISASQTHVLDRSTRSILILFHGASATHASQAHEIARQLLQRGYLVHLAASGPYAAPSHQHHKRAIGLSAVETLPLAIHSAETTLSDYRSCDAVWIDRCVQSERSLIQKHRPDLIIHSMKPTASIAAHLEGVDEVEIIQGYQQPGYQQPFQSPFVPAQPDRFAAYLRLNSRELKRRNKLYFIADTPELYPPPDFAINGFHYVGPLLAATPNKIDHRKTALPVVYLKDPGNILRADLLRKTKSKEQLPYRLLVESTQPTGALPTGSHVEFVGNGAGEPPWHKIHIIAGDLDIKTLYEALAHGVYPIGIASTLEQELQLNRLEEFNLGVKIDPDIFSYAVLAQVLGKLLVFLNKADDHLQQFADHLRQWSAQDLAADWVDSYFTSQHTALRYDSTFLVEESAFLEQLAGTTPPALTTELLRDILRQSVKKDMPHWRQGKQLFFDRIDSWNWLYEKEPRFFAADYKACDQRRRAFFSIDATGNVRPKSDRQRYRLTYTYTAHSGSTPPDQPCKVFIPYPLETKQQRAIQLLECFPNNMASYLCGDLGFFYAYPSPASSNLMRFSYTCELEIDPQRPRHSTNDTEAWRYACYAKKDESMAKVPELEQVRSEVLETHAPQNKKEFARAFYEYLVHRKKFRKTKEPALGPAISAAFLLGRDGGNCIHFAQTFIALCRMIGIPAREKCGALLGYPSAERVYEYSSIDEPIIGHTWVEIFIEDEGWMPVDFHSTAIGAAAITADNMVDPDLGEYIRRNTRAFNAYYFGNLDNQRVLFSNSAKTIPSCTIETENSWQPPVDLQCTYRMRIECI